MKKLNVGLVGYGLMGRAHANAFRKVNHFFDLEYQPVLRAVCGRKAGKVKAFAATWGFESVETDWRKLLERHDIDLVDIAAPNHVHAPIAIAAAKAGKMLLCEKPLGCSPEESKKMVTAAERAQVPNMVWCNYPRVPAVPLAKYLVAEGKLGRIFHCRTKFLQDGTLSKDLPQGGAALWRPDAQGACSGATGDLLAHCIDTALWLNGPIEKVTATTETFIKKRKHPRTGKVEKVRVDYTSLFLARFANGSLASFEASRFARGHKDHYTFELNGEHVSFFCDLQDLHRLQCFEHRDGSHPRDGRSIHVSDTGSDQPYIKHWWVPGLQMGCEHSFIHQAADFLQGLASGQPTAPTFRDGLATDYVINAVLKSAKTGRWETVRQVAAH